MSSKPATAQGAEASELLTESEYRKLYNLRYKKDDIAAMTPELARQKIARKLFKPGTPQAIEQNLAQTGQTAAGVADIYNDDAIEERNEGKANTEVLVSDWYNKNSASCAEGKGTIFDVVSAPVIKRFPELSFRWLDAGVNARLGTDDFEKFIDPETGKGYEVGNQYLAYRPKEVSEQRERTAMELNRSMLRNVTDEVRRENQKLHDQSYGGGFQDNVRIQREGERAERL